MVHSHFSSDNGKPNEERQFIVAGILIVAKNYVLIGSSSNY